MKVNENREVLEYEEHTISHVTSTTHYSKQNGIAIPGEVTTTIKTKQLNGPSQVYTRVETISVQSNGDVEPAAENAQVQSVASAGTDEFLNGPEQVLPATSLSTSLANGRVKLSIEESGMAARPPVSVPGLLHQTAVKYPNTPALVSKGEDGQWKTLTFQEYEAAVRTCAKAFLKLGLKRYHSVGILGFNSPEWFISDLAAIYAGGFAAGIYTTNSPEACHYCALHSRANIIVVEDKKQLDKVLEIKHRLPELKVIVQYHGKPDAEGVLSWEELMKIGSEEPNTELDNVLKTIAINECCTVVFTSGTVGNPKAAMLSHDNFTWNAVAVTEYLSVGIAKEVLVSYLPLSHVAAQILDIYISMAVAATVYFADKDALKGSLVNTLQEVRPTRFLAVPRVWEKIQEKMLQIGSQSGVLKKAIASWAKTHGLHHHLDRMNGIESNSFSYLVARTLIFSRVKQALGLDRCVTFLSGAAPISIDVKRYFMSIDIPVMDGFGMSETAGVHTISSDKAFRLEAIGKTRPGIYSKIINPDEESQGEILFKGRHIFMGYLHDPEKTAEALDEEGWLHSGDLGKIDEDDFVYITGRLKELIITAGGENIAPVIIEEEVKTQLPCISNAMLIGDKRKFLSMLLTFKTEINMENGEPLDDLTPEAKKWCKDVGFEANTVKDILEGQSGKIMEAIQKGIDRANAKSISNAQRIQKFQILPHDFSIPTGEIGPTMKLKRNFTTKMYEDVIERFYKGT